MAMVKVVRSRRRRDRGTFYDRDGAIRVAQILESDAGKGNASGQWEPEYDDDAMHKIPRAVDEQDDDEEDAALQDQDEPDGDVQRMAANLDEVARYLRAMNQDVGESRQWIDRLLSDQTPPLVQLVERGRARQRARKQARHARQVLESKTPRPAPVDAAGWAARLLS